MRRLTAKLSALTLVASAFLIAGPTTAEGHRSTTATKSTIVSVLGTGDRVTLSHSSVAKGQITFKVHTSGEASSITLFQLARHSTLAKVKADLVEIFSMNPLTAAKGHRLLKRDARFFGLAQVTKTTPAKVTVQLRQGSYYLMDLGKEFGPAGPKFTAFTVHDSHGRGQVASAESQGHGGHAATVKMTSAKRFDSPMVLPAKGTVRVRNVGNTLHFMAIEAVRKGTTDAEIQKFFDNPTDKEPPFAPAVPTPGVGLDVLSPSNRAELTYNLKPGTYVLLCFMPDEKTGVPHAVTGMHKVVTVK